MTTSAPPFNALSKQEMDELDSFLLSENTSDEVMQLDTLDGYLTAIATGPAALKPSLWLPGVWGPTASDEPFFETIDQAQRIVDLIVRHMNGIAASLQADPDAHEPIFDTLVYENDTREYIDPEMWACGFMRGIALCSADWQPLLTAPGGAEALRPIYLLGSDDLSAEETALTETPEQREELSRPISASLAWIYRYWQPYRHDVVESMATTTLQRDQPKTGRNDPCPCGSGKKFKKCCGAA